MPVTGRPEPKESRVASPGLKARVQVRYGDFDVQGHVNNAVILQIVESARMQLWSRAGLPASPGQVIRHQTIEYLRPIGSQHRELDVVHRCVKIGRTSYVLDFEVLSVVGDVLSRGTIVLVSVDPQGRPAPVPVPLRMVLKSLMPAHQQV